MTRISEDVRRLAHDIAATFETTGAVCGMLQIAAVQAIIADRAASGKADYSELLRRLHRANEYEPLGHDGWEAADAIDALQARVAELKAGLRGMLTRHSASTQNWEQAAVDAQRAGNFDLRDQITNTALQALAGFPVTEARALIERKPS